MGRHRICISLLFAGVLLVGGGGISAQAAPDTLTTSERQVAARVAEVAVDSARTASPIYLVDMELIRGKEREADRRALVTHYRYEGDLSLFTTVDLATETVAAFDSIAHVPAPLSAEEVAIARRLALANPAVQAATRPYAEELVLEPLLIRAASEEDPLFEQRAVRLLLRIGRRYLEEPVVTVNLTTEEVVLGNG